MIYALANLRRSSTAAHTGAAAELTTYEKVAGISAVAIILGAGYLGVRQTFSEANAELRAIDAQDKILQEKQRALQVKMSRNEATKKFHEWDRARSINESRNESAVDRKIKKERADFAKKLAEFRKKNPGA